MGTQRPEQSVYICPVVHKNKFFASCLNLFVSVAPEKSELATSPIPAQFLVSAVLLASLLQLPFI